MIRRWIHLENSKNLGDHLLQLNYMRQVCRLNVCVGFVYYCRSQYHAALRDFLEPGWGSQFSLQPWFSRPVGATDVWIGGSLRPNFYWTHPKRQVYNEFYLEWFKLISGELGLVCPFNKPADIALDHPIFDDNSILPENLRGDIDCLLIDCAPMSGQFRFNQDEWDAAKTRWRAAGLSVVAISELKPQLSLPQIGVLACQAAEVVSVCTGPLHAAFNQRALRRVRKWHVFHACHSYSYVPQIQMYRSNEALRQIKLLGVSREKC